MFTAHSTEFGTMSAKTAFTDGNRYVGVFTWIGGKTMVRVIGGGLDQSFTNEVPAAYQHLVDQHMAAVAQASAGG